MIELEEGEKDEERPTRSENTQGRSTNLELHGDEVEKSRKSDSDCSHVWGRCFRPRCRIAEVGGDHLRKKGTRR